MAVLARTSAITRRACPNHQHRLRYLDHPRIWVVMAASEERLLLLDRRLAALRAASALGSEPHTSARPPALANGATSALRKRILSAGTTTPYELPAHRSCYRVTQAFCDLGYRCIDRLNRCWKRPEAPVAHLPLAPAEPASRGQLPDVLEECRGTCGVFERQRQLRTGDRSGNGNGVPHGTRSFHAGLWIDRSVGAASGPVPSRWPPDAPSSVWWSSTGS